MRRHPSHSQQPLAHRPCDGFAANALDEYAVKKFCDGGCDDRSERTDGSHDAEVLACLG